MKWIVIVAVFTACVAVVYGRGGRRGRCQSAEDCAEDECCLAKTTSQLMRMGRCRSMGSVGQLCTPSDALVEYYGNKYVQRCPCRQGLTCQSSGRYRQSSFLGRITQTCQREAATSTTSSTTSSSTTSSTTTSTDSSSSTTPTTSSSTSSSSPTTESTTTTVAG